MITFKEKKQLVQGVKNLKPIGTEIYDPVRSEPYTIHKQSVFEIYEFEYADEYIPDNNGDIEVEVLVRNRGKHTPPYLIGYYEKKYLLK